MNPHDASPQQAGPGGAGAPAQALSGEELRERVAELAEQVRLLRNGSHPPPAAPAPRPPEPRRRAPAPPEPAGGPARAVAEELAEHSGRLLSAVIETAEMVAAEIRAGAEREAAAIRESANAAIGEADAVIARHRAALAELADETARIERAVAELRGRADAIDAALARLRDAL